MKLESLAVKIIRKKRFNQKINTNKKKESHIENNLVKSLITIPKKYRKRI